MTTMHLSEYMAAKGLNDDAVADKIGCTRATVSRIRRRKVRPAWDTIEAIRQFTKGASTADDYVSLESAQ